MPMIREDGRTERQARVLKTPAWLGRNPNPNPFGQAGAGGTATSVQQQNAQANYGTAYDRNYYEDMAAMEDKRQLDTASPYYQPPRNPTPVNAPVPNQPSNRPAWMTGPSIYVPPGLSAGQRDEVQNQANVAPNIGLTPQGTPNMGANSFISQGGDAVIGPNQMAYTPWMQGVNTFIGAGGQAVRGPDGSGIPIAAPTGAGEGTGSGGFGSSYYGNWRRGGGGGRGGGGYGYTDYGDAPAWFNPYMNLYSWNYRG